MVKVFSHFRGIPAGLRDDRRSAACFPASILSLSRVFLPLILGCAFLSCSWPSVARAMTADGAMITNFAAATGYWGVAGGAFTSRYLVSYNATTGVLVSCPVVFITKLVTPTMLAVSQTATYTVCVVNTSQQATAWNVVVQDKLPDNMGYVNPSLTSWVGGAAAWSVGYSTNGGAAWLAGEPWNGSNNTVAPYSLRWVVNLLGPNRSGCVTFRATVQ